MDPLMALGKCLSAGVAMLTRQGASPQDQTDLYTCFRILQRDAIPVLYGAWQTRNLSRQTLHRKHGCQEGPGARTSLNCSSSCT